MSCCAPKASDALGTSFDLREFHDFIPARQGIAPWCAAYAAVTRFTSPPKHPFDRLSHGLDNQAQARGSFSPNKRWNQNDLASRREG